jgi:hypothetical protein
MVNAEAIEIKLCSVHTYSLLLKKKRVPYSSLFTAWMQIYVLNITEDVIVLTSDVLLSYKNSFIASTVHFVVGKPIIKKMYQKIKR